MNTSPNPMIETQIKRRLNEMVDYHLCKSPRWPADDKEVPAFWRILEELRLTEAAPGEKDAFRFTTLGIDCGAPLVASFIGAIDLTEIPMVLETEGLIDEQEAEAFFSSEDENVRHLLEVMVRLAHRRYCAIKNGAV